MGDAAIQECRHQALRCWRRRRFWNEEDGRSKGSPPFPFIFFSSHFSNNINTFILWIEERESEKQKQSLRSSEFIIFITQINKRIKRNKSETGSLGSGCGGDSSLRWRWRWSESDLNLVMNTLEQELSRERHYFALLGSSQSPNQSFKDVGTSIVIEQHTKRHLNPTQKKKNQINPQDLINQ